MKSARSAILFVTIAAALSSAADGAGAAPMSGEPARMISARSPVILAQTKYQSLYGRRRDRNVAPLTSNAQRIKDPGKLQKYQDTFLNKGRKKIGRPANAGQVVSRPLPNRDKLQQRYGTKIEKHRWQHVNRGAWTSDLAQKVKEELRRKRLEDMRKRNARGPSRMFQGSDTSGYGSATSSRGKVVVKKRR